jgi:tellurite methyltransferase
MRRTITRFVADDAGDWIAELSCGHDQHVHHRPPFQDRPWVLESATRLERVGTFLQCPLCDHAELPARAHMTNSSPSWDEITMPESLRRSHRLPEGKWGVLRVDRGQLGFITRGELVMNVIVSSGSSQGIPPGLDHSVEFSGPVRCRVDFFSVERVGPSEPTDVSQLARRVIEVTPEEGGDSACWANLVCPACGSMIEDEHHTHGPEFDL